MLELYQAEWCPHSHKVRQRLTELGLDFVARQVDADREARSAMMERVGTNEIPVLVTDDETTVRSEEAILRFLDGLADERPDADLHRRKSAEEVGLFAR